MKEKTNSFGSLSPASLPLPQHSKSDWPILQRAGGRRAEFPYWDADGRFIGFFFFFVYRVLFMGWGCGTA
jgi:hypothetical protein